MKDLINYICNHKKMISEFFNREKPTLVEIQSGSSGGSHLMTMIINKIEQEYLENLNVVRIDFEAHKELFDYLGIEKAPAFLLINKGQIIEIIKETVSKKNLEKMVCNLIGKS